MEQKINVSKGDGNNCLTWNWTHLYNEWCEGNGGMIKNLMGGKEIKNLTRDIFIFFTQY